MAAVEVVRVLVRDELAKRSLQWKQRRLELRRITVSVNARVRGLIELELGQRQRAKPVARGRGAPVGRRGTGVTG